MLLLLLCYVLLFTVVCSHLAHIHTHAHTHILCSCACILDHGETRQFGHSIAEDRKSL